MLVAKTWELPQSHYILPPSSSSGVICLPHLPIENGYFLDMRLEMSISILTDEKEEGGGREAGLVFFFTASFPYTESKWKCLSTRVVCCNICLPWSIK